MVTCQWFCNKRAAGDCCGLGSVVVQGVEKAENSEWTPDWQARKGLTAGGVL